MVRETIYLACTCHPVNQNIPMHDHISLSTAMQGTVAKGTKILHSLIQFPPCLHDIHLKE